jgi:hypothetical protein
MIISTEDHATYSASGSKRWLNCPGSIALGSKAPDQPDSPYAMEGTKAHECLEKILSSHPNNVLSAVNKLRKDKRYNEEMIDCAVDAYKWISDRAAFIGDNVVIQAERKVDASPFTTKDQFGTLDCAIFEDFGELNIIDYKYGKGIPVDPSDNPQLIYYALAVCHEYNFNFSKVNLVIIQPRAEHDQGPIREYNISIDKLFYWNDKFKRIVEKIENGEDRLESGEWCRFCKAATICPQISSKALTSAKIAFKPTEINDLPKVNTLELSKISLILKNVDKLKMWISEVEKYAFNVLSKGVKIDGFKLVERRGVRKWVEANKVKKLALKHFGEDCLTDPELLSPARFETKFKKLKSKKVKQFVEKFTASVSSGMTLVSDDDKRESKNNLKEIFKD